MATDGPDPTPCNQEVFNKGEVVFMTHSIPSNAMEGWVRKVAKLSGQRVDWHFFGGRARILALGDIEVVKAAIIELLGEHDDLYREAVGEILGTFRAGDHAPRPSFTRAEIDPSAFERLKTGSKKHK